LNLANLWPSRLSLLPLIIAINYWQKSPSFQH
jgi:hypothetical protein